MMSPLSIVLDHRPLAFSRPQFSYDQFRPRVCFNVRAFEAHSPLPNNSADISFAHCSKYSFLD